LSDLKPIIGHRKVIKLGSTRYISIPSEWFKAHNIDPDKLELLMIADKDIRIMNPEHEAEVYDEVTKIARGIKV